MILSDPVRTRRAATAFSLFGAAILILAGVLTSPGQGQGTTSSYLADLAADPGATQLSAVLLRFGYLLLIPAAFGLMSLLRVRMVALGHVAIVFCLLGAATMAGNIVVDFYDLALAEAISRADAVKVADAAQGYGSAAALIVPGFLGSVLGFTLLSFALYRAGWVGAWVPALMAAAWVSFFALTPVGATGLFVVLVVLAVRVARTTSDEWSSSTPATEEPPSRSRAVSAGAEAD